MKWIIGIDEVGRGPLAGPVTVCAVAMTVPLYKKRHWPKLTDSKKLSIKNREHWYRMAKQYEKSGDIKIAIASRSAVQIDRKGISACIRDCISSALKKLDIDPSVTRVLLDGGLRAPVQYVDQQTIIRGDQFEQIISMASVIAKVTRDGYMTKMHQQYPGYGWDHNKGYGTKQHLSAIKKLAMTTLHRKTFIS